MATEEKNKKEGISNEVIREERRVDEETTTVSRFLPIPFCVIDSLNHITDFSYQLEVFTGYGRDDLLGSEVYFLFKEKEEVEEFLKDLTKNKKPQKKDMVLVRADKKELWVSLGVVLKQNSVGDFVGCTLSFMDISEIKEREKILEKVVQENKEKIESISKTQEESEAIMKIRIEAKTKQLKEINEGLEEKIKERTKELQEKALELEERAKDMEQTQTALLNLAEDTEKASQEAQQEKEKTMTIINSFVDGLLFFNEEKKLTLANPRAEEIFDVKLRDIEGRSLEELATFPTIKPVIEPAFKGDGSFFRYEIATSKGVFLEVTVISVRKTEKNSGTLINIHDITREKAIEKIKSEFVSVAAHQLRTPLSGIKWTLKTILEEEDEVDVPAEIMDFIRKAYEANDRMVHLVNDLLNVSRIEEGRYAYDKEEIDFLEAIDQIVTDYKEHIEKKGLKFKVEKPEKENLIVSVDKEKIIMVVQNFLDNAMKYTKEGEITLKIEKIEDEIKVSVVDTGVGIPEDQQKRMFSKFFRAANVQRMDTEGSGLGLFIAKNIVEAHSGKVGFSSVHGEGSTFYFLLPQKQKKEADVDDLFKPF